MSLQATDLSDRRPGAQSPRPPGCAERATGHAWRAGPEPAAAPGRRRGAHAARRQVARRRPRALQHHRHVLPARRARLRRQGGSAGRGPRLAQQQPGAAARAPAAGAGARGTARRGLPDGGDRRALRGAGAARRGRAGAPERGGGGRAVRPGAAALPPSARGAPRRPARARGPQRQARTRGGGGPQRATPPRQVLCTEGALAPASAEAGLAGKRASGARALPQAARGCRPGRRRRRARGGGGRAGRG